MSYNGLDVIQTACLWQIDFVTVAGTTFARLAFSGGYMRVLKSSLRTQRWITACLTGGLMCAAIVSSVSAEEPSAADERSSMRLPAIDPRTAVSITGEDRAYVLGQMRLFLANIQRITAALASNDPVLASKVAAIAGAKNNENDPARPATLRARQPATWNQYIGQVRKGFDDLSSTAATAPVSDTLYKLSALTQNCVACHQTFRIID